MNKKADIPQPFIILKKTINEKCLHSSPLADYSFAGTVH